MEKLPNCQLLRSIETTRCSFWGNSASISLPKRSASKLKSAKKRWMRR
jgi:hypothetical protein